MDTNTPTPPPAAVLSREERERMREAASGWPKYSMDREVRTLLAALEQVEQDRNEFLRQAGELIEENAAIRAQRDTFRAIIEAADTDHADNNSVCYGEYDSEDESLYLPPKELPNIPALEARYDALAEAARPFVAWAEWIDGCVPDECAVGVWPDNALTVATVGDLRRLRAAVRKERVTWRRQPAH